MRQEKQLLLDEIKGHIEHRPSFVIAKYSGFNANQANDFRTEIAKTGGDVEMVPKRVLLKAAEGAGIELDSKMLDGHISLIFAGEDPLETAKFVFKFGKDNGKVVQVIGGRVDGLMYDGEQMETLSKLPGKDQMRAQLLGLFEAPMSQSLAVMDALMCSVIHCMEQKAKQEQS